MIHTFNDYSTYCISVDYCLSYLHRRTQEVLHLETPFADSRVSRHKICDIISIGTQL